MRIDIIPSMKEKLGITGSINLPYLELGERMGGTGYIDFLRPKDLESPIMAGIDRFNRFFLAIKLQSNKEIGTLVVFNRYTDNYDTWVNCGLFDVRLMYNEYWPIVRDLLINGKCTYKEKDYKVVEYSPIKMPNRFYDVYILSSHV